MSSDDYTHIKKAEDGRYLLFYGVASNDHLAERAIYESLEDAIEAAQELRTEYGLTFDFGADTKVIDLQASDVQSQDKGNDKAQREGIGR